MDSASQKTILSTPTLWKSSWLIIELWQLVFWHCLLWPSWKYASHVQCGKFPQVRRSEADNFGGIPGNFCWFVFNFRFMICDSRHEDLQLFWLRFKHWSWHHILMSIFASQWQPYRIFTCRIRSNDEMNDSVFVFENMGLHTNIVFLCEILASLRYRDSKLGAMAASGQKSPLEDFCGDYTNVLSGHPSKFLENPSFLHFFRLGWFFLLLFLDLWLSKWKWCYIRYLIWFFQSITWVLKNLLFMVQLSHVWYRYNGGRNFLQMWSKWDLFVNLIS